MPQNRTDNFSINAPKAIDSRYLKNGTTPYSSPQEAHSLITYKYLYLSCIILVNGQPTEHWYKDDIALASDLVVKDVPIIDGVLTNNKLATDIKVGSLTALNTTTKANLVAAINEVKTIADNAGGGSIPVDGSITNVKLANVATSSLKGRLTTGTGSPEDLTPSQVKTLLSLNNVDNISSSTILTSASNAAKSASTITEDTTHRFSTDTEKAAWNSRTTNITDTASAALMDSKDATILTSAATAAANANKAASTITGTKTAAFISDFNTAVYALVPATVDETFQPITYQASLSIAYNPLLPNISIDLTGHGNIAITNTGTSNGSSGQYRIKQDATPRTVTINGTAIPINPASGSKTNIEWRYDGTDYGFSTNYVPANGGTITATEILSKIGDGTTIDPSKLPPVNFEKSPGFILTEEVVDGRNVQNVELNEITIQAIISNYLSDNGYSPGGGSGLVTPSAPINSVVDDEEDTFGWTDTGGKTYVNAEVTNNGGTSWVNANGNPHTGIGNINLASGQLKVRYKAVDGVSNASPALSSTAPYTASPTNLLSSPTDIAAEQWAPQGATFSSMVTSYDGSNTARNMIETAETNYHGVNQDTLSEVPNGSNLKLTVYAKASTRSSLNIGIYDHASGSATTTFNLSTGIADTSSINGRFGETSPSNIQSLGGGWYKCTMYCTKTEEAHILHIKLFINNGGLNYLGDGTSSLTIGKVVFNTI